MNTYKKLIFSVLLASVSTSAYADSCGCSAALDANLMDTIHIVQGGSSNYLARSQYCENTEDSKSSGSAGSAEVGFKGFSFGGSTSKNKSSKSLRAVCDQKYSEGSEAQRAEIIRKNVNPTLAAAFSQCILACNNNEFGFKFDRDERNLSLNITNKQGENAINDLLVVVDDVDRNADEKPLVECAVVVGGKNIVARKSIIAELPPELSNLKIPKDDSAKVACTRDRAALKSDDGTKTVEYYPGYRLTVGVGAEKVEQYVPTRPAAQLSSVEYDRVISELNQFRSLLTSDFDELTAKNKTLNEVVQRLQKRKWNKVSRAKETWHTNARDYPIEVSVSSGPVNNSYNFCHIQAFVDGSGSPLASQINNNNKFAKYCSINFTVPPKTRYRVKIDGYRPGGISTWWELY